MVSHPNHIKRFSAIPYEMVLRIESKSRIGLTGMVYVKLKKNYTYVMPPSSYIKTKLY